MPEFVTVASATDVGEGDIKAFDAGGTPVAVARVGGNLHAFSDVCTHRGCFLSSGELEDSTIYCECHGSGFSIETGEVVDPPATEPIAVYPVREQDGQLEIEV
jgi:3-phenylpropionate/trans-cinnamate dioxygenase ferredoxin subunit